MNLSIDAVDFLRSLERKKKIKLQKKALRKAANIVKQEIKKGLPKESGLLKRKITYKIKVWKHGVAARIGASRQKEKVTVKGRTVTKAASRYFHLIKGRGKSQQVAAEIDAAVKNTKARCLAAIEAEIKQEIEK